RKYLWAANGQFWGFCGSPPDYPSEVFVHVKIYRKNAVQKVSGQSSAGFCPVWLMPVRHQPHRRWTSSALNWNCIHYIEPNQRDRHYVYADLRFVQLNNLGNPVKNLNVQECSPEQEYEVFY